MGVKVKLVGFLKKYAPQGESLDLEDADGRTVAEVAADLGIPPASVSITLVNGHYVKPRSYVLQEGDELTLLPPIGGGGIGDADGTGLRRGCGGGRDYPPTITKQGERYDP